MDNSITYRMADADDAGLLAATRVEFFIDMKNELTDDQKAELYERSKAFFDEALRDGSFAAYLAFDGSFPVGTGGASFYRMPPSVRNKTGRMAYISNMYTKPEYRGRGVATRLFALTAAEAKRRGCGKLTLHASDMGRPIYEKYGLYAVKGSMEYLFE